MAEAKEPDRAGKIGPNPTEKSEPGQAQRGRPGRTGPDPTDPKDPKEAWPSRTQKRQAGPKRPDQTEKIRPKRPERNKGIQNIETMTNTEKREEKTDEIADFTLNELLSMASVNTEKRIHECLIAHNNTPMEVFRFPFRIDAFIVGICTEGCSTLSFNLQEYRLQKNDLFIYPPKNIIQVQSNENFRTHAIVISTDFLKRLNIDITHMIPLFLQFASQHAFALSDEECGMLRSFFSLIDQQTRMPDNPFIRETLGGLVTAMLYQVASTLQRYAEQHPRQQTASQSRAEEYFRQFMLLLGEHYKAERSVGFYARKLCITPKYLTTLIRRISNKSVSEWIDNYVILEAKTLLKFSNMSIQEIAYTLNFPNQSFFGSYFKRNTGMSPSQYKLGLETAAATPEAIRGGV